VSKSLVGSSHAHYLTKWGLMMHELRSLGEDTEETSMSKIVSMNAVRQRCVLVARLFRY
jgi:hypothetical protein